MSSQLPPLPPAAPAAKPPSIPSTATTTTLATAADGTTTISLLGQDQLLEIFLRLPSLPALARAALTCRSWLGAVRSSRSFRSLFRALHPAPLVGIFLELDEGAVRSFAPFRCSDPDVTAALRRGDFFLTSLTAEDDPHAVCWEMMDCRDGYILLWNMVSVAVMNPMTWAVNIIPVPEEAREGSLLDSASVEFHLLSSEENPWSFSVVFLCAHISRLQAIVFSSETRDWVVHPWMEIGGEFSMMFSAATLLGGYIYRPLYGEGRVIRINIATMDVSSLYLPSLATDGVSMGDTEDGKLCMVYASTDDLLLHVWIRSGDGDGIESWVLQDVISLRAEIDEITPTPWEWQDQVTIVEVRPGCVYFSMTCITDGTERIWFFYLSIKTMEIELLMQVTSHDYACPYTMAWPPCLIGDDRSTKHEAEGSGSCLLKSSNSTKKRKSSSPVGLAIDFNSADASRQPLQPNSPDCRLHKK
ncbi:hypothetical protein CFC21_085685 [Triticum aestivum]|uniref:F-box protein AT5G49610-like beta-propeller domain-containing protein n=2 Tax=Triticum aestivum TaxID=4565 RepID=A0A9R1ICT2_WHEAT|nr:uncharacterized protein LOC123131479 isoform X2 [Triticum aestivum]KAF7081777.1 hypothetical protein CFC21_085685 [Triticum aestivum]